MQHLAQVVRWYRVMHGRSYQQLADAAGTTSYAIRDIEQGYQPMLDKDQWMSLAAQLPSLQLESLLRASLNDGWKFGEGRPK